jgi:hypothetical protein
MRVWEMDSPSLDYFVVEAEHKDHVTESIAEAGAPILGISELVAGPQEQNRPPEEVFEELLPEAAPDWLPSSASEAMNCLGPEWEYCPCHRYPHLRPIHEPPCPPT